MKKAEELVRDTMTRINCIRAREIHGNISPEILAEIILLTVEQSIEHGRSEAGEIEKRNTLLVNDRIRMIQAHSKEIAVIEKEKDAFHSALHTLKHENEAIKYGRRLPIRFVNEKPKESGKYIYQHSTSSIVEIVWVDVVNDSILNCETNRSGKLSEMPGKFSPRLDVV